MSLAMGVTCLPGSIRPTDMESKLAIDAERALVEATQKLSPQEEIHWNVFCARGGGVAHCEPMYKR